MKKKSFVMVLALVLVFAVAVGGVVAWLTDKTGSVVNTFTVGDINITLEESGTNEAGEKSYKMIPGTTLDKDPTVTVIGGSEACYLFVKVEKGNNPDNYLDYTIDTAVWTAVPGHEGFYYCTVSAAEANQTFNVLTNNEVTVKTTVTKDMIKDLTVATYPTLTFTAAAVQQENITTVDKAFAQLPGEFTGATVAP